MLCDFMQTYEKYGMDITGVLHVGAHIGEEAEYYEGVGVGANVLWVEANPEVIPTLAGRVGQYGHKVANVAITDTPGSVTLHVTNNVMSSSILDLGTHLARAPFCVYTHDVEVEAMTIDQLCDRTGFHQFNTVNMDIQGAELLALKGAIHELRHVEWLYTEINFDELYIGCARAWELDEWLWNFGLYRVETWMAQNDVGWGDALYCRRERAYSQ